MPLNRFCQGTKYADVYAYERFYNKGETRWEEQSLRWGCAYRKDISVRISRQCLDVNLPEYEYEEELGFVEIPRIFDKKWVDGTDVKLLYTTGDRKAIVTYTTSVVDK